ncbi:alpha/beta fold hydrolase [Nannocystis radixulma]|uniref:Alpha/beta hydrolase n=1 Tax=Nannocystis radixulma TaxID=2995305 RepID=A0ABT5B384_9BACT|nr:alpha/beta hydrolase [Nannocystis radixulma]MDC0667994.1 alpha/beta hydrolase [Nannocystis radixulma]
MSLGVLGVLLVVAALIAGGYVVNNLTYFDRGMKMVRRAGFIEKQATIDGSVVNYAEGPDNGPALLLIHGQMTDWENYYPVLPELAKDFHVFAVDCYGHGGSAHDPAKYSAAAHGHDLQRFLAEVVGERVIVSGHSSGGQLAAWLAAYAPEQVSGVVLEDPPMFTTLLPRAKQTWNYADLATNCHDFLAEGGGDFVAYHVRHTRLWRFFGDGAGWFIDQGLSYRAEHPDAPVKFWAMPPIMNEAFRGLHRYDPCFGDAFYTGSWDADFDHAATLAAIDVPAVLVHTDWQYDDEGILMASMDGDDAERARSLIKDVEFYKATSGHGFHWEKPDEFVQLVRGVAARTGAR